MLRVTFMHKDSLTSITIYCDVFNRRHDGMLHFYHYADFYFPGPNKPFRSIKEGDFYWTVGFCTIDSRGGSGDE